MGNMKMPSENEKMKKFKWVLGISTYLFIGIIIALILEAIAVLMAYFVITGVVYILYIVATMVIDIFKYNRW